MGDIFTYEITNKLGAGDIHMNKRTWLYIFIFRCRNNKPISYFDNKHIQLTISWSSISQKVLDIAYLT